MIKRSFPLFFALSFGLSNASTTTPITLYKDKDCNAIYKLELDEIPTANAIYYHTTRYGECQGISALGGDCSKMTPVTDRMGKKIAFEEFTSLGGSRSGFDTVAVYPDSVRLYDAEGIVLTFSNPLNPNTDRVVTKDVTFRTLTASGQCNCKEDVPYGYATANLSNFKKLPAILDNYNLPVGINTYVWYFSNTYEKEDPASKVLVDSCVVTIVVKDTISPKLECGSWEGTTKYYADQSYELSQSKVNVIIPTLTQLNASDNCTATEDLKLSWVRTFKGEKSTRLAAPYTVGETTIDWIVSDESGNSHTCTQYIQVVVDTLEPIEIDCVTLEHQLGVNTNTVPQGKDSVSFKLPIPEYTSGCGFDTDVLINIMRSGQLIYSTTVRKTEIITDSLNVKLKWGEYVFKYIVKDGCGRSDSCSYYVRIIKEDMPVIAFDSILDIETNHSDFNELASNKCVAFLNPHVLNNPYLVDQNDVNKTKLTGEYAGRRHFDYNSRPSKVERENWKSDEKEQTKFDTSVGLYDEYEIGYTYILWKFTNEAGNSSYCVQEVRVRDTVKPYFDCATIDPFEFRPITKPGECEISFGDFWPELNAKKYIAYDSCPEPITPIYGVLHADSINNTPVPDDMEFHVGDRVLLYWQFRDKQDNVKYCPQVINVTSGGFAVVDCDTILDETIILQEGLFEITKDAVLDSIKQPHAIEYCTGIEIKGVPQLMTISTAGDTTYSELPAKFAVGEPYYISWLFANKDLTVAEKRCDIELTIKSSTKPIFDCSVFNDTVKKYLTGVCDVVLDDQILPIPTGKDACVDNYVVYGKGYKIDTVAGNVTYTLLAEMNEGTPSYKVGKLDVGVYNIAWIFESKYSTAKDSCYQTVKINSSALDSIHCGELSDVVHVTMLRQGAGVTFQDVVDAGLIVPKVWDPCGVLDMIYTRDDSLSIYDDIYPVNKATNITWTFKDTTKNANREKVCHTVVEVLDGEESPYMICPDHDSRYNCLDEIPAQYADYVEFVNAGGMLIKNMSNDIDFSSFRCDTMSLGDKCDYTFVRKYSLTNIQGQEFSCDQRFRIRDTVAPVWMNDVASKFQLFDYEVVDFFPTDLEANDECSNYILNQYYKVDSFDVLSEGLFYTETSDRSSDPSDCMYYNYTITQKFMAVDRCRNHSDILEFTAKVQGDSAPIINMPDNSDWRIRSVSADYSSGRTFLYPDIVADFPIDSIKDNHDQETIKYYRVFQTPAAGDTIRNTSMPQYITLHIVNPCGFADTLMKKIKIAGIVDIPSPDTTEFIYTGDTVIYKVPDSPYYSVSGNAQTYVGTYTVTISLLDSENYMWSDGSTVDLHYNFMIKGRDGVVCPVAIPIVDVVDFIYNGERQTLDIPESPYYTVSGDTQSVVGSYSVIVSLIDKDKTTWQDGTVEDKVIRYEIYKAPVDIPAPDSIEFVYNGDTVTYSIPESDYYTVEGNVQTEPGNYEVVVSLKDSANYSWSDGTTDDLIYPFVISGKEENNDTVPQIIKKTVTVIATEDSISVEKPGDYVYDLEFDSVAHNNGFVDVKGEPGDKGVVIQIPENLKPGVYDATVTITNPDSTIVEKEIHLNVLYPNSLIVRLLHDVLTVDNTSKQFVAYQWYKNGKKVDGATHQYYCDLDGIRGTYKVQVVNTAGDTLFISERYFDYIPSYFNVTLCKNPAKTNEEIDVIIEGVTDPDVLKNSSLVVYNMKGEAVLTKVGVKISNSISIGNVGEYIVVVRIDNGKTASKHLLVK